MPRPGHIYVLDAGEGVLKVGFSNNSRLGADFEAALFEDLESLYEN
ncbi:hypothetical protein AB1P65_09615 [Roseibium alexandrii]